MTKKTRKPANASTRPAKRPSGQTRQGCDTGRTGEKGDISEAAWQSLRSVRRRRIRQAAGGQVHGRRPGTAGKGRRVDASAAGRGHRARAAEIAAKLPAGRLHANAKGLVPYVKADLYTDLMFATLAGEAPQVKPDPAPQDLPRTWDDVAPGHLVIARETLEIGWWEAVVVERTGDLVTVKYRDYPQYPPMVRHRSAIALITPPAQ